MVSRIVWVVALAGVLLIAPWSVAQQDANPNGDALAKMQEQLQKMQNVMSQLHAENQQLRQALQNRTQPAAQSQQSFPSIFAESDSPHIEFYPPAGAAPPSWIDAIIESNRQRNLEGWAMQRASERIVDRRIVQIRAESRAIGARYAPRPLREAVLAGADPKKTRDDLVSERTADFNELINQPVVQDFLKVKVALIEHGIASVPGHSYANGRIGDANVMLIAERIKRDVDDAGILYGENNGGFRMAIDMTQRYRDNANVEVSGPTREVLAQGRRQSAVDAANISGVGLDEQLRRQAVAEMQRLRAAAAAVSAYSQQDVNQINGVLNGKFSRTSVPHVQSAPQPNPPRN